MNTKFKLNTMKRKIDLGAATGTWSLEVKRIHAAKRFYFKLTKPLSFFKEKLKSCYEPPTKPMLISS